MQYVKVRGEVRGGGTMHRRMHNECLGGGGGGAMSMLP